MTVQWDIKTSSIDRWDEDVLILYKMKPHQSLLQSKTTPTQFWTQTTQKVRQKAQIAGLSETVVQTYIERAKKNPNNWIALTVTYK